MVMTAASSAQPRTVRFLRNVLWSWMGVAFAMFAGLILSPFMIRRLGEEGYGIWALVFALIDYYDILDFGFRSAVVKYTAHYRATGELDQVNTVINTALVYFSLIGALVLLVTVLVFRSLHNLFQITLAYQPQFAALILLVGISWALGAVCHSFSASLEGFQRYDLYNRTWILYNGVRAIGCAVVLLLGYGLVPLGMTVVASQVMLYAINYRNFRKVVPGYRFDPRGASRAMLARLFNYGKHTFLANSSWQVVSQGPAVLIGHFLPAAFVGYYAVPSRLIQISVNATDSVISVSGSQTAELTAKDEVQTIPLLGLLVNRYCLMIFMPIAVILALYRNEIIETWIRNPVYVMYSAPLLPILLLGAIFVLVGQVNTPAILYGLGKHQGYARGLVVEACLSAALLAYTIPRYGIPGAACVAVALMILDRGIYTPWYLCRVLRFPYARYMTEIYTRPLLAALPVIAVAYGLKATVLPGRSLLEIAVAAMFAAAAGWGPGAFLVLEREHRSLLIGQMASLTAWLTGVFRRQPAS
ncbi:MAG: hypothetical protein C5B51_27510 [Terriglobia bacterium]|nr:MAG: hypothetical protein C5B51_27510 [Terriglobia bacterium]